MDNLWPTTTAVQELLMKRKLAPQLDSSQVRIEYFTVS